MALIDNVVGAWHLDESSGDAIDSVNSNDGTVVGPTQNSPGKLGTSYLFDGSSDYVSIPDNSALDFSTAFTVSLWIKKAAGGSTNPRFLSKRTDGPTGSAYNFGLLGGTDLYYEIQFSAGSEAKDTNVSITDTNWHHVVFTFDNSTGNILTYLDGSLVDTNTGHTGKTIDNTSAPLYFGAGFSTADFFSGSIDEVNLFDAAKDSTEVTELWNSSDGLAYPYVAAAQVTKDGNARIDVPGNQITKTGNARIQIDDSENVYDSDARIAVPFSIAKTGNARIKIQDTEITKTGNASLNFTKEKVGNANINVSGNQITKTGSAYISTSKKLTKTGNARIDVPGNQRTEDGDARITVQGSIAKTGNSRIEIVDNQINKTGNASIELIKTITYTGNASVSILDSFAPTILSISETKPTIRSVETFN